ncbi:MAG: type II toxin-antitoxin system RelE/ParE family toxin [Muribaculaceae bacterium]|nr:type II toxin-antitoxin system RelE/ParE family toxin [Muribaculaceae bacterium]
MIVTFEETYLKELYENGATSDKKHRFQPNVINRYKICVDYLRNSSKKEDLFLVRSLHFEALKGDKRGLFSIRVNRQYRIEFTLQENIDIKILTICNIVELSNHYD